MKRERNQRFSQALKSSPSSAASAMPGMLRNGFGALALSLSLTGVAGASTPHPLDGLSPDEISQVGEILRTAGLASEESRYALIELLEPPKEQVLSRQADTVLPRQATVHFREQGKSLKATVDLTDGRVVSTMPLAGQAMILLEEFLGSMELALGDPAFVEALAARDLTPDDVFCLPLTAGSYAGTELEGRRIMKVPCYVNPTGSNFYAKPIEGLFAVVDVEENKVVEVVDEGVVPLPSDPWGYTDAEIQQRVGKLRPEGNPVTLQQPGGPNYSIDGAQINWDMWQFRYRTDKRPGMVLSDVRVQDQDQWRSVLYQTHLSEVFVPYMDPGAGWYWRTYMDSGEYGFGLFMSPLRPGIDCPDYATYLPAVMHQDDGSPLEIPDAICVFERNIGDPAWRHYEVFAQSETQATPAEGRPATQLVVRSASEVGNYDYLIDYVFNQNGSMDIMVGSTGLDAVKGVASTSMNDDTAAQDTRYGTLIAPNLVAPNHDHFFNFRIDFDIDGTDNTFMRSALVAGEPEADAVRRSFWTVEKQAAKTELEGRYKINPATPAMYHVMNMNEQSALGHHPGYMIMPKDSVAYGPLDTRNDPPMMRNGYIDYTIWNTAYHPTRRYAGGELAFASSGADSLPNWVKANRSIDNTDIVTWYTMGFHHVPRMEDWPVMSTMWKGIKLVPFNFFAHNPAASIRTPGVETPAPAEASESTEAAAPAEASESTEAAAPAEASESTEAAAPAEASESTEAAAPAEASESTEAAAPAEASESTEAAAPAEASESTEAAAPAEASESTEAAAPAESSESTEAAAPAEASESTEAAAPAEASESTEAAAPAEASESTEAAAPVEASESTEAAAPAEASESTEAAAPAEASESTEAAAPAEASESTEAATPADADKSSN